MIPKNKRHLIVNKEYSRLPYWTDEGYDDVQRQVSQKYVQDNYGKFAESENQPPYLSDADYQGLEYQYQNPEFFDPTDLPDVDMKNTAPKGTCYELWVSLFGSSPHGFFPTASEYAQLMAYAKKCPLIYMPHWCCSPSSMKISGPASVAPGEKVEYTVSGGLEGCSYMWDADRGWMVSGTYEAPDTPGSDRITVSPYLSDDMGKVCAFKDITIEGGCHGVIGYTTLQMTTSATQTLTVTGGGVGDTYTWSTTSGSFDTDTGTSVVYTAPSSNANCTSNPTITLTCGGSVVDTVQIAIRANSFDYNKAAYYITVAGGPGTVVGPYVFRECEYNVMLMPVRCDGSSPSTWDFPICGTDYANPYVGNCPHCAVLKYDPPGCWGNWDVDRVASLDHAMGECASHGPVNTISPRYVGIPCGCANGTVYDVRTAQQKADGCCPAGLL